MKNQKLQSLEATLSKIAGLPVEITIRAEKAFTVSIEGNHIEQLKAIQKYLAIGITTEELDYDSEADLSYFYFTAK